MQKNNKNFNFNLIDQSVGQQLCARREAAGLSQKELGDYLGITLQQVQKYEHGINRLSASKLYVLGELLDVPVQYFFNVIDEESTPPSLKLSKEKELSSPSPETKENKTWRDIKILSRLFPGHN